MRENLKEVFWKMLGNGWVMFLIVFTILGIIDQSFQKFFDIGLFDSSLFTINFKFMISPDGS